MQKINYVQPIVWSLLLIIVDMLYYALIVLKVSRQFSKACMSCSNFSVARRRKMQRNLDKFLSRIYCERIGRFSLNLELVVPIQGEFARSFCLGESNCRCMKMAFFYPWAHLSVAHLGFLGSMTQYHVSWSWNVLMYVWWAVIFW